MRQVVDSTQISGLPGQLTQRSQRHEFFKPNAVHKPIFFDGQNIYTPASKVMITSNCIKLTYQDNIDGTFQTQHNISEDIEEIRWNQYITNLDKVSSFFNISNEQLKIANHIRLKFKKKTQKAGLGGFLFPQSNPSEDGTLQLSWDTNYHHIDIEIYKNKKIHWFSMNMDNDKHSEGVWTWSFKKLFIPSVVIKNLDILLEKIAEEKNFKLQENNKKSLEI
jgi:hypothetical protein